MVRAAEPVQPQQPVAPEGWFRDGAPAAPAPAAPQASAGPAAVPAPAPGTGAGAGAGTDWAETAYLPPYPGPADPQAQQRPRPQMPSQGEPQAYRSTVAPEGWFRDDAPAAPAPAPAASVQDWAAETAYLPPVPPQNAAAAETAFLPPVQEGAVPEGWFRDAAPAAAAPAAAAAPGRHAAPAPGGPADPADEPEWSPPTLGGNTMRAVDPAQARAEGRSPIIDPGPQSAVVTTGLGLLLAVAAVVGDLGLLLPLVALQGLTAAGWFRLNGMWPARQGIALAFAGALVADAAGLAVDDTYAAGAIIGTLGVWVLLTLVLQLRSQADPDERMYGLMASVASAALAIVCAGYLAADSAAVTVGAVAVAVAVFVRALPLPPLPSAGVALAAAAGAGIAVGGMTSVGVGGALLGLAAGVCALIGLRVAAYDYPSKFVHMTAGVALPLAAAAPAVYLMGRVVG
ncbi:hypothetical protein HYE82_09165 [Streptomyces sp. BR123]|nr:hypothetical protein [Streptomyces sp. BR123]